MKDEKKRILELVQNGKLSAEEAIILLEALEKDQSSTEKKVDEAKTQESSAKAEETTQQEETKQEEKTGASSTSESFYSQVEQMGEKLFEFLQNALNKIKDIDFQFTQSVEFPHTFQQAIENINRIDIDLANGPLTVRTWDESEVRIECNVKVYRTEDREEARSYFLENTIFRHENDLLVFATQSKWMKVDSVIYIPKKLYDKISLRVFHGDVKGEQLEVKHLVVKTTNAKATFRDIVGEKVDINTVNGNITLTQAEVDRVEAETVNGSIETVGTFTSLDLQSLNGNITSDVSNGAPNKIDAETITGNVRLTLPADATVDGEVKSNIGNYNLHLKDLDILHEKQEIIQKQVKFKRTGTSEETIYIDVDTKTGSIFINEQ